MGAFGDMFEGGKRYASKIADVLSKSVSSGAEMYGAASQPAPPEVVKGVLGFTPGVGDAISAYDAYDAAKQGNYGEAALNAIGVLPGIPSLGAAVKGAAVLAAPASTIGVLNKLADMKNVELAGSRIANALPSQSGMIKTQFGRIAKNGEDTRYLADMLKRAGESAGYDVTHSRSAISPSQYVSFTKRGDEARETTRQVRISNHADKYPELRDGIRTSSDPDTGVSFEQSVNWLASEGFPTRLSARFKDIPSWEQYYATQRALNETKEVRLQKMIDAWRNKPKASRGPVPTLEDVK